MTTPRRVRRPAIDELSAVVVDWQHWIGPVLHWLGAIVWVAV